MLDTKHKLKNINWLYLQLAKRQKVILKISGIHFEAVISSPSSSGMPRKGGEGNGEGSKSLFLSK